MTGGDAGLQRAREASRERQRRWRERRAGGTAIYPVAVSGDLIDALIRWGWLLERDATDQTKVSAALSKVLADAIPK